MNPAIQTRLEQGLSETTVKRRKNKAAATASKKPARNSSEELLQAAGGPVQWPEVLRALGRDSVRSYAMSCLAKPGFSADLFGADRAHARASREAVVDALTATEDWLEYEHPKYPERETIKTVRRRLEVELWP